MLKMRGKLPDGRTMLILGLTHRNLDLLRGQEDRPIVVDLDELGYEDAGVVIISGGATQADIAQKVADAGGISQETVDAIREAQLPED